MFLFILNWEALAGKENFVCISVVLVFSLLSINVLMEVSKSPNIVSFIASFWIYADLVSRLI